MICKKCQKEISDGSIFCNWCGKKQETTKRKTRRRAKGLGSIRYDSRCKNNPYLAYAPRTANTSGRYLGSFPTSKSALAALDKYFRATHIEYSALSLEQIYNEWSKTHFEMLSASGKQGYKTAYKFLDTLYSRKFNELKTADFQRCIDKCSEKFSRSQCEKVKQLCSQLCKYAMQNDMIDKNYAEFIKLPKAEKREKQVFTESDLKELWQNSNDKRVQLILIMCYTGFRIGEICNIKKECVSFEENYIIAGEKTKAGIDRYVPIQADILPFVKRLYFSAHGQKLIDMDIKTFRNKIFYSALADLKMINPPVKNEKTGKLEYKNPKYTPHCTRHTFATLCVNAGIAPEDLQRIIGHAKYETTADIYVHENTEQLQNAMSMLKLG